MNRKSVRIIPFILLLLLILSGCAGRNECPSCEVCEVCEVCETCPEPVVEEEAATSGESLVNIDDVELVEFDKQLFLINLLSGEEILLLNDTNYENIGVINNNFIIANWGESKIQFFNPIGEEVYYDTLDGFASVEIEGDYLVYYEETDPDTPDQKQGFVIYNTENQEYPDISSAAQKNGKFYYEMWFEGGILNRTYYIEALDFEGQSLVKLEHDNDITDCALTNDLMVIAYENNSAYIQLIPLDDIDSLIEISLYNATGPKFSVVSDRKVTLSYTTEEGDSLSATLFFTDTRVFIFYSNGDYESYDW